MTLGLQQLVDVLGQVVAVDPSCNTMGPVVHDGVEHEVEGVDEGAGVGQRDQFVSEGEVAFMGLLEFS